VPTYQYACTACDHAFEQVQSFTDDSLTQCPECQGRLRKVFNAVGVVFKGSGFYRTDSRADAKSGGAKSAEDGASSSGSSEKSEKKDNASGSNGSSGSSDSKSSSASSTKGDSKSTSAA
jgi:putative FmdB family regulatory protein